MARFLAVFLPATGLRRKEIRLARLQDLDLRAWHITVSHPKGEGSWATDTEVAPIAPFGREALMDFLAEREKALRGWGLDQREALIPFRYRNGRRRGTMDYMPDGMLGKLKADLERSSGVGFHMSRGSSNLRATFGQMAIDGGAPIESVSRAMRHRTTRTTEEYYARIRTEDAFADVGDALARTYAKKVQNPRVQN